MPICFQHRYNEEQYGFLNQKKRANMQSASLHAVAVIHHYTMIGRCDFSATHCSNLSERPTSIAHLNRMVEGRLPESAWDEWLWGTDAARECDINIMMNRMHLLGLLIARSEPVPLPMHFMVQID
jgi:hypothetical protein